jgi:hypothetical protein
VSDGIQGYSIEHPTAEKKSLTGMNYAQGHSATVKKGVPAKLTGEHEITIQNLSGYTRTYSFGYWLSANGKTYRVDDRVSIIPNGVFMLTDSSYINGVVFNSTGTYILVACTYSTDNQTACDREDITVNK